jgi:hypothetical protein
MSAHRMSPAIKIALCWAVICSPILSSQTPVQPGRLVITSTPTGAKITVNSQATNQLTDATFAVPPGKYTVSVTGGPGHLNCPDRDVQVSSGQPTEVHCSATGWTVAALASPPPVSGVQFALRFSILLRQQDRGCRAIRFGDYPQPLRGVCLVAAQQSKPMSHAVLILCDTGWLQLAPVPGCMTGQETGRRLLRSLECG